MFKPDPYTTKIVSEMFDELSEMDKKVENVMKHLRPLADLESLDDDTIRLLQYGDTLNKNFGEMFVSAEELDLLMKQQV